jgi:hypothetical protein
LRIARSLSFSDALGRNLIARDVDRFKFRVDLAKSTG